MKALKLNWFRFDFDPLHVLPSVRTGSARAAHVRPDSGFLRRGALLRRHGMHVHRRGRQNQGPAALQRSRVPPLRRPVDRKKKCGSRGGEDALPSCSPCIQQYVCLQVWPILPATAYTSTGSPEQPLQPIWHLES